MGRLRHPSNALPAFVRTVRSRGRPYYYFHRNRGTVSAEPAVRLPGEPFDARGMPNAAWWDQYRLLVGSDEEGPKPGSFSALVREYKKSPEWRELGERTRQERVRHLDRIEAMWGGLPVKGLEPRHVLQIRDSYSETPASANNLLIAVSALVSWSIPRGWRQNNPCVGIKRLKLGEGYPPWSWEQIELFRQHARAELWQAAALALYSGQRLSDVLKMRWDEVDGQLIGVNVQQNKTAKKLWVAMHAELKQLLSDIQRRDKTILTSSRGTPWTVDGFKASWSEQMKAEALAPLRKAGCVFHGLRKSAVVFLLEAGCTDAEVAAITGQSRDMVEHYARKVNQKRLAAAAILKWEAARQGQV